VLLFPAPYPSFTTELTALKTEFQKLCTLASRAWRRAAGEGV